MIEFNYSIQGNTANGVVNFDALVFEWSSLERSESLLSLTIDGDNLKFVFENSGDIQSLDAALDNLVSMHQGQDKPYHKIYDLVREGVKDKDFRDIDYTVELIQPLYPKRTFYKGELRLVEWFSDSELTNKILRVEIAYVRDYFGFAVSRTTVRKWVLSNEQYCTEVKVTEKKYTINTIDQITEGKRRRENIVNGVQLPTLQFMVETIQGISQVEILLMGRDFMDRFSLHFKNFIDNSSSITDTQNINFGKKTVVVAFEEASQTTDIWLLNKPASLGGQTSILDYLSSEFTI